MEMILILFVRHSFLNMTKYYRPTRIISISIYPYIPISLYPYIPISLYPYIPLFQDPVYCLPLLKIESLSLSRSLYFRILFIAVTAP